MTNYKLIMELTEALENTVPKKDYSQLIVMLCRVTDALETTLPHIRNKMIAKDAQLICSLVSGFLNQQNPNNEFYNIYLDGFGEKRTFIPAEYLRSKGVKI
jgi:hypothetical protein